VLGDPAEAKRAHAVDEHDHRPGAEPLRGALDRERLPTAG
jgi:hypothetical protein